MADAPADTRPKLPTLPDEDALYPVAADPDAIRLVCALLQRVESGVASVIDDINSTLQEASKNWQDKPFRTVVARCGSASEQMQSAADQLATVRARLEPLAEALTSVLTDFEAKE